MLDIILQTKPDPHHMPVSAELVDQIRELLANRVDGSYDVDAVLFNLAFAVYTLEQRVLNSETRLRNVCTRLIDAGVPAYLDD